jgi:hypothetical protein
LVTIKTAGLNIYIPVAGSQGLAGGFPAKTLMAGNRYIRG